MFSTKKKAEAETLGIEDINDVLKHLINYYEQLHLVGNGEQDPVRKQTDKVVGIIEQHIARSRRDEGSSRFGGLKIPFFSWDSTKQKRATKLLQSNAEKQRKFLQIKTRQRQEFSLAYKIYFSDRICPLQNGESDLTGIETDGRLYLNKYKKIRPYLTDLAKTILATVEHIQDHTHTTLAGIKSCTKDIVRVLELIVDDMSLCWWNGATHEALILSLRNLMRVLALFASQFIDNPVSNRGSKPTFKDNSFPGAITTFDDLSLFSEDPSQIPEYIQELIREDADVVVKKMGQYIDSIEAQIEELRSNRTEQKVASQNALGEQQSATTVAKQASCPEHEAIYKLLELLCCSSTDFSTLASGEDFALALQALGIRVYGADNLGGIERELIRGGGGRVSLLELDNDSQKSIGVSKVAVKSLIHDKNQHFNFLRFMREARVWSTARTIMHPDIVDPSLEFITPLLGVWVSSNRYGYQPSFIMPFADDSTLCSFLDQHEVRLSLRWKLLLQVIKGLKHLHDRKIVHGDLKPLNVLIFRNVSGDADFPYRACLIDFGISELLVDGPDLHTNGGKYTNLYASPELVVRDAWKRYGRMATNFTDIYAYGCMIVEVVTGSHPYASINEDQLSLKRRRGISLADDLKEEPYLGNEQRELVEACLSCIPEHRPHARDLIKDIEKFTQI